MTVKELIEILQTQPEDAEVCTESCVCDGHREPSLNDLHPNEIRFEAAKEINGCRPHTIPAAVIIKA